jgi:hypothetical protein
VAKSDLVKAESDLIVARSDLEKAVSSLDKADSEIRSLKTKPGRLPAGAQMLHGHTY